MCAKDNTGDLGLRSLARSIFGTQQAKLTLPKIPKDKQRERKDLLEFMVISVAMAILTYAFWTLFAN